MNLSGKNLDLFCNAKIAEIIAHFQGFFIKINFKSRVETSGLFWFCLISPCDNLESSRHSFHLIDCCQDIIPVNNLSLS